MDELQKNRSLLFLFGRGHSVRDAADLSMYELVLNQFVSLPKFHADPHVAETYSSTVTSPLDI